jgi:hypothetical protein
MDTTAREIWYWLTAGALEKLRLIQAFPLDTPISYWLQVAVAGFFWIVIGGLLVGLIAMVSYEPMQYGARRKAAGRAGFWQSLWLGLAAAFLVMFALFQWLPPVGPLVGQAIGFLFLGIWLGVTTGWYIWGRRGLWERLHLMRRAGRWYAARMKRGER